jgi:hypothetical protein
MRVNYGEVIKSLRVLLHRSNYIYTKCHLTTLNESFITSTFGKIPPYYGFDSTGIHVANNLTTIGTSPFNYVKTTPVQWILPCFIGYRGSGVWTFNPAGQNTAPATSIRVVREPVNNMVWSDSVTSFNAITSPSVAAHRDFVTQLSTVGGAALTNQITQAGISVLCPNYNLFKMNSTAFENSTVAPTSATTDDGSASDTFQLSLNTSATIAGNFKIEKYWHAGPDFQPLFFLNVPTYRLVASVPTPV